MIGGLIIDSDKVNNDNDHAVRASLRLSKSRAFRIP